MSNLLAYPQSLVPKSYESVELVTGQVVKVPKAIISLKPWLGKPIKDTYGNKQAIDSNGEPVFAELAILRLLQAAGWQGAWIDTYRHKKRISLDRFIELPSGKNELLEQIYLKANSRSGCFDIYCWHKKDILFAEAKRQSRDKIRESQRRWLTAALSYGHELKSFLIVEWTLLER